MAPPRPVPNGRARQVLEVIPGLRRIAPTLERTWRHARICLCADDEVTMRGFSGSWSRWVFELRPTRGPGS